MSQTPARVSQFPPEFGENTRQVLAELGYKDAEIDDLAGRGVI